MPKATEDFDVPGRGLVKHPPPPFTPPTREEDLDSGDGQPIPGRNRAIDQQLPVCTPTADQMLPVWASQNAACKQIILRRLCRENPVVREMVAEIAALKAENVSLKAKANLHKTK
jgi:hypothetical protein